MENNGAQTRTISERLIDRQWLVAGALLLVIAVQGYAAIGQLSITFDEPAYLFTGYARLVTGDRTLGVFSGPPLMKYIIGLPLFFRAPQLATADGVMHDPYGFKFGLAMLYKLRRDIGSIVRWGRLMVLMVSLVLAVYVFVWARRLFGPAAGLLALALYAGEPNLMAHATLATTDFGVTALLFIAAYYAWRYFTAPDLRLAGAGGIFFGLALGVKTTAILLLPALLVMALLFRNAGARPAGAGKPLDRRRGPVIFFLAAFVALWSVYGFQVAPLPQPGDIIRDNDPLSIATRELLTEYAAYFHGLPLPASSWLVSTICQLAHAQAGHEAYLLGQYSQHGWWYYIPFALLIKTPLPLLAAVGLGLIFMVRSAPDRRAGMVLLLVPVIFLVWSLFNKIDIGIRYVLPVYPFLIVFGAQAVRHPFAPGRWPRVILAGACLWLAVSAAMIFPDYLAYFNELVGGSRQGHKYLIDSNLDWGQGLLQVKEYMEHNRLEAVKFSYFGSVNPLVYGIALKPMRQQESIQPERDIYLISVSSLFDIYCEGHQGWQWARARQPTARIGASVLVYDLR